MYFQAMFCYIGEKDFVVYIFIFAVYYIYVPGMSFLLFCSETVLVTEERNSSLLSNCFFVIA